MQLSLRIFIGYFFLVGLGLLIFLYTTYDQLQPVLRQASEETLVDTANLLAEFAPSALEADEPAASLFARNVSDYRARQLSATIWSRLKTRPDLEVYLTDQYGDIVFHTDSSQIGKDYSRWRDVRLTLAGEYGARTTRSDADDPLSSTMYIAAPVYQDGNIMGVVTVGQPNISIQPFLDYARRQILQLGSGILLLSIFLGALISIWLTHSVRQLVNYVERAGRGEKVQPPILKERSLAKLADSTENMRREIEGKAYIEGYVHNLAHEMKSPLSAVRGAVEILQEERVDGPARQRFMSNIDRESRRMQQLIDRLLSLATLENRHHLQDTQTVNMLQVVNDVLTSKAPLTQAKSIQINIDARDRTDVTGELFLLEQAVSNLLDNAIDFCPDQGHLDIHLKTVVNQFHLTISNDGQPIPDYAHDRLFERFYSLNRPETNQKSTGLGLSFVREIAELHGGSINVSNAPGGGVMARLALPVNAG